MIRKFTDNWPEIGVIDRIYRPEFTGENRCIPCTMVNLGIAVALAILLGWLSLKSGIDSPISGTIALGAFVFSTIIIYLRGYLIPYTPIITKRYFPDRVLKWFEAHSVDGSPPDRSGQTIDVESFLISNDIVTDCEDGDLCLEPTFKTKLHDHISAVNASEVRNEDIAEIFDIDDPTPLDINDHDGQGTSVQYDGRRIGQWESDAAFLADIAANRLLQTDYPVWDSLEIDDRGRILNSLRMFLEDCPRCGAPVTMGEESVESCCRVREVIAVSCVACEARLFEIEITPQLRHQLDLG